MSTATPKLSSPTNTRPAGGTNSGPTALGLAASFGFGDRFGAATPGHVDALKRAGGSILPIFAQQSIREMTRTDRTPQQVMADAENALGAANYTGPRGADADHLKTNEDVDRTASAGFVFFTIDPSGFVDASADDYSASQIDEKFSAVRGKVDWIDAYLGKRIKLASGTTIDLDERTCRKAAVKYGLAVNHAVDLASYIAKVATANGQPYEIELSVDETPQPTTLAEHYIIASECLKRGMKLVSLAPRYVGDFEKGIDYIGSLAAFELSLTDHAAIAELLGPYKLSLHSGSDKLSIYPSFARITRGRFHVKTAGTSYLEALRVVAIHDPKLFRTIIDFSRSRYDIDKATYHVSATNKAVPAPADVASNDKLESIYLEKWSDVATGQGFTEPGRQILHCTFGSVLTDATLGKSVRDLLAANAETYRRVLGDHFAKHLGALRQGM